MVCETTSHVARPSTEDTRLLRCPDSPASSSQRLGLQACTSTPSLCSGRDGPRLRARQASTLLTEYYPSPLAVEVN